MSPSLAALSVVATVLLAVAIGLALTWALQRARHEGFREAASSALVAARVAAARSAPQQTGRHAANITAEMPRVTWPESPDPLRQKAIGSLFTRPADEDPGRWR